MVLISLLASYVDDV